MRISKALTIAAKDFKIYLKKRSILSSFIIFPLIASVGLPIIVQNIIGKSSAITPEGITPLLNSFLFFFIIGGVSLPTAIASYSFVGEKTEKSIEPLLATPVSDSEILLGKTISSFLPALTVLYAGAAIFMILINSFTYSFLGYLYYPNAGMWIVLLILVPLSIVLSVETNIMVSSKVSDVRAAQQFGGLIVLPFAALYVMGEIHALSFTTTNLFIISAVLLAIDFVFFILSIKTFQREEILTKWK